jgi:hypothetical protein
MTLEYLAARWAMRHLERAGFVILKRPPTRRTLGAWPVGES